MTKARFFLLTCVIIPLILALFSCAKNQTREEEELPITVKITPVTEKETAEEVKGFGSLSYLKKLEILSPLEGVLETLNFREGDRILKGDIVGRIHNPQVSLAARRAEDAYSQALAAKDLAMARLRDGEYQVEARLMQNEKSLEELAQARRTLEEEKRKSFNREIIYTAGGLSDEAIREERFRIASAETQVVLMERELEIRSVGLREEDLIAAGVPVPDEKDELWRALVQTATSPLRAEAAAAQAYLEAASREMESCRIMEAELIIRSPGPGIIGARYVEQGERIKRDDRILTIMDTDSLYAIFPAAESDALKLEKGMAAQVTSGGEEIYEGKVDLISPQADNQSFTFLVRIILDLKSDLKSDQKSDQNNESPLRPGMFARVTISLENPRKITVIPEAALAAKKDNAGRVFAIRGNVLSERNVVLGGLFGDEREILSGLSPGEVVVLGPNPSLREGAYVSPID